MPDSDNKQPKKRLGQGLQAIIQSYQSPDEDVDTGALSSSVARIPIDAIIPNPFQPRQDFDAEALEELAASLEAKGMVQPITVRQVEDHYEIVAGERRWRAAKSLGWDEIPAYLLEVDSDVDMMELALIENLQRQNLNPVEEGEAYRLLIDKYGISQEKLGESLGKNRSTVTNTLRLLKLPDEIKRSLRNLQISAGHARALLGVEDARQQVNLWRRIIKEALSVRETETLVRRLSQKSKSYPETTRGATKSIFVRNVEERLMTVFGTRVQLKQANKKGKGRIEIEYYSADDLERLLEIMDNLRS
ncbi:MAG: ParB/RepB/Spo0J family partition protein [Candidatus Marinimicrobia bacterium]|nr:ParB/RepB/Spo0J family partition protein [Candidatus Neomarinimicrobiota bacterium]MCF7839480.1 ParB/RepB/Spo0J family partition protein [Candidatus Neomarinimicrobiota bacterium]